MSNLLWFLFTFVPWFVFLAVYTAVGGAVMARSRAYMFKYTDMSTDEAKNASIAAGCAWPLAVPWFIFARAVGNIDPNVRAEKKAADEEATLIREQRLAKLRAAADEAKLREEILMRQRARLNGEEIPYTKEEVLEIEDKQARVQQQVQKAKRAALENVQYEKNLEKYR